MIGRLALVAAALATAAVVSQTPGAAVQAPPGLEPFASDAELAAYLDTLRARPGSYGEGDVIELEETAAESAGPPPAPAAAPPPPAAPQAEADGVTNNQTAGVDEGGIVKKLGDHLLVLRRGRLFTVHVGGRDLAPVDAADASGPDVDPAGTWYDELLVVGRTAVVVGYSYRRGGTELVLFDVGRDGRLVYRSTYHLRSNDYYSAEAYASRVVGGRLVLYTPLALRLWGDGVGPDDVLPALRRWTGDAQGEFEPIASASRVYRPARDLAAGTVALHTVTTCAVSDGALDCDATAVFGPFGHTFYVSGTAVYAWLSG